MDQILEVTERAMSGVLVSFRRAKSASRRLSVWSAVAMVAEQAKSSAINKFTIRIYKACRWNDAAANRNCLAELTSPH